MDHDTAARLFAELGNRTRLEVLRLLIKAGPQGLSVGEIQQRAGIPASTLAFHLRGLVGIGLVSQEKAGRVIRCRPSFARLNEAMAFMKEECCAGFASDAAARAEDAA